MKNFVHRKFEWLTEGTEGHRKFLEDA